MWCVFCWRLAPMCAISPGPHARAGRAAQDFSTGSVGLGAALTTFSAYIQDYLTAHGPDFQPVNAKGKTRPGRTVAIVGDAELDEGRSICMQRNTRV